MFEVQHKCHPGDADITDFTVINREEDGLVVLLCPGCREQFWVKPTDPDYFNRSRRSQPHSRLILPGYRA